jgi:hypothetical protein
LTAYNRNHWPASVWLKSGGLLPVVSSQFSAPDLPPFRMIRRTSYANDRLPPRHDPRVGFG